MDNVKTFFKTLLWTLVVLIVLFGGFWAYMKFFNQDLAKSFTELVYTTEAVECAVCDECEVCDVNEDEDEDTNTNEEATDIADIDFDREFERLNDKMNDALDMLDEMDNAADMDEYGVVEAPEVNTEMSKDEIIEDLMNRIKRLEDK